MEYVNVQDDEIPALGFGTWQIRGSDCREAVRDALAVGYRHIDTAQAYENEQQVGRAIDASDVDRDDIFLTTKLWHTNLEYDDVMSSAEASLTRLGTDYVDLLLIHWPVDDVSIQETLEAMMELQDDDKVRHVGVSNFPPSHVEQALEYASIACNQIEYHPYLAQDPLLSLARDNDMMVTAYSPLARGRVLKDDTLSEIGEAHGKSPAQVALRWVIQQDGVSAIPKAASADHRRSNLEIFDFELSDEEVDRIASLDEGHRIIDPSFAPDWEQ